MNEIEQILDAMLARNDVSVETQGDICTVKAGEITLRLEERHVFLYDKREIKCLLTARFIKVGGHGTPLIQEVDLGKYYKRLQELSACAFAENYANVLELASRKLGIQQKGDNQ